MALSEFELNRQLQSLSRRVKSLEKTVGADLQMISTFFIQLLAALEANGLSGAAALLAANPQLALLILQAAGFGDMIEDIPALDYQALIAQLAVDTGDAAGYDSSITDEVSGGDSAQFFATCNRTAEGKFDSSRAEA